MAVYTAARYVIMSTPVDKTSVDAAVAELESMSGEFQSPRQTAQTQTNLIAFDVGSIEPNPSSTGSTRTRVSIRNGTLAGRPALSDARESSATKRPSADDCTDAENSQASDNEVEAGTFAVAGVPRSRTKAKRSKAKNVQTADRFHQPPLDALHADYSSVGGGAGALTRYQPLRATVKSDLAAAAASTR